MSYQVVVNSHTEGEIWGLCAHPEKDVFVTGSDDKTVRLWDLTKKVSVMLKVFLLKHFVLATAFCCKVCRFKEKDLAHTSKRLGSFTDLFSTFICLCRL